MTIIRNVVRKATMPFIIMFLMFLSFLGIQDYRGEKIIDDTLISIVKVDNILYSTTYNEDNNIYYIRDDRSRFVSIIIDKSKHINNGDIVKGAMLQGSSGPNGDWWLVMKVINK